MQLLEDLKKSVQACRTCLSTPKRKSLHDLVNSKTRVSGRQGSDRCWKTGQVMEFEIDISSASSSAFPSYISGVHHFLVRFLRM